MNLTRHAQIRINQRGIPPLYVDWLEEFGVAEPQNSSELIHFDQRSLKKLASYTGGISSKMDKLKKAYLVRSNSGSIITTGYLNKSIKRK